MASRVHTAVWPSRSPFEPTDTTRGVNSCAAIHEQMKAEAESAGASSAAGAAKRHRFDRRFDAEAGRTPGAAGGSAEGAAEPEAGPGECSRRPLDAVAISDCLPTVTIIGQEPARTSGSWQVPRSRARPCRCARGP